VYFCTVFIPIIINDKKNETPRTRLLYSDTDTVTTSQDNQIFTAKLP